MQRKKELLRLQRGGPYGTRIPGTPLASSAQLLKPAGEPLAYGVESVSAFMRGVERGFGQTDSALYEKLQRKLSETMVSRIVVPQVSPPGRWWELPRISSTASRPFSTCRT
jgi:hypothetical protein